MESDPFERVVRFVFCLLERGGAYAFKREKTARRRGRKYAKVPARYS